MKITRIEEYRGFEITVREYPTEFGSVYKATNNYGEPYLEILGHLDIDKAISIDKQNLDLLIDEDSEDSSLEIIRDTIQNEMEAALVEFNLSDDPADTTEKQIEKISKKFLNESGDFASLKEAVRDWIEETLETTDLFLSVSPHSFN
jgi:hypothetical protein